MSEQPTISPVAPDAPIEERLKALVENISAYIEYFHGGSVTLVDFDGTMARVKLGGACEGCDLSAMTLKGWVEGTVQQFFPEISVEAAED